MYPNPAYDTSMQHTTHKQDNKREGGSGTAPSSVHGLEVAALCMAIAIVIGLGAIIGYALSV